MNNSSLFRTFFVITVVLGLSGDLTYADTLEVGENSPQWARVGAGHATDPPHWWRRHWSCRWLRRHSCTQGWKAAQNQRQNILCRNVELILCSGSCSPVPCPRPSAKYDRRCIGALSSHHWYCCGTAQNLFGHVCGEIGVGCCIAHHRIGCPFRLHGR